MKRINLKNQLPELLEAVCNHKDCPDWLKLGIVELLSAQTHQMNYSASHFRAEFESLEEESTLNSEVLQ